jgi:hypothetical protein
MTTGTGFSKHHSRVMRRERTPAVRRTRSETLSVTMEELAADVSTRRRSDTSVIAKGDVVSLTCAVPSRSLASRFLETVVAEGRVELPTKGL